MTSASLAKGVDVDNNAVTISIGTEPPTLDVSVSEDQVSNYNPLGN